MASVNGSITLRSEPRVTSARGQTSAPGPPGAPLLPFTLRDAAWLGAAILAGAAAGLLFGLLWAR